MASPRANSHPPSDPDRADHGGRDPAGGHHSPDGRGESGLMMSLVVWGLEEQEKEFRGVLGRAVFCLPRSNHSGKGEDIHQENSCERHYFSGSFFREGIRVVGGIISIVPDHLAPFAQVFREYACGKERVEPFGSTSFVGVGPQRKRGSINHFSAGHSASIRFSPLERVEGLKKEHGNIVRNKLRSFRDRRSWINIQNSVTGFIFNGRWMVGRKRGLTICFYRRANPSATPIAMEIGCPPDEMGISIGAWRQNSLHLYFRDLGAGDFFRVTMWTCNREYCHV